MEHAQQICRISFCSLFLILFFSIELTAQEYLGEWSFKEVDTTAIQGVKPTAVELNRLARMFQDLSFKLNEDNSSVLSFAGKSYNLTYEIEENVIRFSDKNGVFYWNGDETGVLVSGNAHLIMHKGKVANTKVNYSYIKKLEYATIEVDTVKLLKKWKTEEVRMRDQSPESSREELLLLDFSLHFLSPEIVSTKVLFMDAKLKWETTEDKGIILIESKNQSFKKWAVYQQTDSSLLIEDLEKGHIFYMKEVIE